MIKGALRVSMRQKKAFDFMLNYVGNDAASGPVWMEYITFLKSMPAVTPQEESHRMTTVRKVYQKAILVPTNRVEQLWKDYENFENSVSRTLVIGISVWILIFLQCSMEISLQVMLGKKNLVLICFLAVLILLTFWQCKPDLPLFHNFYSRT